MSKHPNLCQKHPKYTGGGGRPAYKPRTACPTCLKLWELERQVRGLGQGTPGGYSSGPPNNTRADKAREEGFRAGLAEVKRAFQMPRAVPAPSWSKDGSLPRSSPGTPVLFLSDIHAGEVVNPAEVMGKNVYDWATMERRFETVFSMTVELLTKHLALPRYDGIVVPFGGDFVSGEIHEEL